VGTERQILNSEKDFIIRYSMFDILLFEPGMSFQPDRSLLASDCHPSWVLEAIGSRGA
jgi:hypothetical protein